VNNLAERLLKNALNSRKNRRKAKREGKEEAHWDLKIDSNKYNIVPRYLFDKFDLRKIPFTDNISKNMNGIKSEGTKFIAMDIPYANKIMSFKDNKGYSSAEIASLKKIKEEYDIDFWEYDGQTLYFKDFHDFVHFNSDGASVYKAWFVDNLSNYIKRQ
jgi:hypothetical protein